MNFTYDEDVIRVVILDISGVYSQIFDEIYCKSNEYHNIVDEYSALSKYKVIKI